MIIKTGILLSSILFFFLFSTSSFASVSDEIYVSCTIKSFDLNKSKNVIVCEQQLSNPKTIQTFHFTDEFVQKSCTGPSEVRPIKIGPAVKINCELTDAEFDTFIQTPKKIKSK